MGTLVDYRTDRGVAVLKLTDPPANSYTLDMIKELDDCITDARFDEDVHVVVLTGHGEQAFCIGANVSMLREVDPDFRYNFFCHAGEILLRLERMPKLVIAAINGHAVGGGLELALACDLRMAREGAGTVGFPEVDLGLMPGTGGVQRLVRTIGKARAMQFLIEGAVIDFEAAASLGIINHVWPAGSSAEFLERVLEYAHQFTLPARPPLAMGCLKRAVQAAFEMPIDQAISFEAEMLGRLLGSADATEGINAWAEKRRPTFQGK